MEESWIMGSACCVRSVAFFDGSPMRRSRSDMGKIRSPADSDIAMRSKAGAKEHEPSGQVLDHWINERLRLLYGPVLSEPIPDDLAQLIEQHRRRNQPS